MLVFLICCFTICAGLRPAIYGVLASAKMSSCGLGGWKTRSVFQRYDIVDNRDIADAMKKLEQSEKPKPEQIGHVLVTFDNSDDAEPSASQSPQVQ